MKEIGLPVIYDGTNYRVIADNNFVEYPVGGLICELSRFRAGILKEIFDGFPGNDEPLNRKNASDGVLWVFSHFPDSKLYPVQYAIVMGELTEYHLEYFGKPVKDRHYLIDELNKNGGVGVKPITDYILKDTGTDSFKDDTVGHYLSCIYAELANSLSTAIAAFHQIIDSDGKAIDLFIEMSTRRMHLQDIDYKIAAVNGDFQSVYTIKNALSLFVFEVMHMIEREITPKKCKNCGEYFVPTGRKDARYCNYPAPQNKTKTCKEIGAQATRAKKEKEDPITREYRRAYMRVKMAERRTPNNGEFVDLMTDFLDENSKWKKKVESANASETEYLEWLKSYSAAQDSKQNCT